MKEFKGTPGPWRVSDDSYTFQHVANDFYHQISAGTGYLNEREAIGFSLSGPMTIHDANLIAAAPELLVALEMILSYHDDGNCVLHKEDVSMARAAINKALGE